MGFSLEQTLGCFGYWGFGGGFEMGEAEKEDRGHNGYLYCNKCPAAALCGDRHRTRASEIYGGMATEYANLLATHDGNALAAQKEFMSKHGCVDPFTLVMSSNIQDGRLVGLGDEPAQRPRGTLTWPLTQLEHHEA